MALVVIVALREVSSWVAWSRRRFTAVSAGRHDRCGLMAVALSAKLLRISEFDEVVDRIRERLR